MTGEVVVTAIEVDIVVVGAGFAGLRALHTMRGNGYSVAVLDEAPDIGGVWYWNRYPGARCDVESFDYSYAFSEELEQEWRWSERYAGQEEILRYINHVADRFDLRKDVYSGRQVTRAAYDEDACRWSVQTAGGECWRCQYLILAVGQLSTTKAPDLPGQSDFAGAIYHSARWPLDGVDFSGKRVGIIGTGSSGTQMIPIVAQEAEHLTVFQRTPNFSIPASNAPISDERDAEIKASYRERRRRAQNSPSGLGFEPSKRLAVEVTPEERRETFERAWPTAGFGFVLAFPDLILDQKANDYVADFVREKIAEKVNDPVTREKLMPRDHRSAPSDRPSTAGTSRPSTATTSRSSTFARTRSTASPPTVFVRRAPITTSTSSSSPPASTR
jgi:cyclohexanone monooxygenase